ncbi:MAG: helix-turn-helix transcriptional regulator [Sphingopyxis sp.]|nr:helix-turn-helix transcriptional regulator [Sphingopyxis sp.]
MNAEMLKGHLDNVILATLERGPAHGYAVIEAIRQRSGGHFDLPEGTVYPALHRLELAGLLASDWVTPDAGRRKRVYTLTPAGTAGLKERREGWAEFSRAVGAFLEPGKPWPA